ncbi:MAG: xanthine dehydrogenase family protein subunit M [Actinomycetes bacterium]
MKPSRFQYVRPASIPEAVVGLQRQNSKVLAGGQSLTPLLSMRLAAPEVLVDINGLSELAGIELRGSELWIGAIARHQEVLTHPLVGTHVPLIQQALTYVAHPVIRNRGTSVGSIAHADPAGELTAVAALLGARIHVVGPHGVRDILANDFFVGPLESSLTHGELVTGVSFPVLDSSWGSSCVEVARRHGDYALAGVCALVQIVEGRLTAASIAIFSVAGTPVVIDVLDVCTDNEKLNLKVQSLIDPDTDIHATADYRRQLVKTLVAQALTEARSNAESRTS